MYGQNIQATVGYSMSGVVDVAEEPRFICTYRMNQLLWFWVWRPYLLRTCVLWTLEHVEKNSTETAGFYQKP